MSSDEVSALISLAGAVLAAVIGAVALISAQQVKTQRRMAEIHAELRPNHGTSARDSLDRIERRQAEQHEVNQQTNARQDRAIDGLREQDAELSRRVGEVQAKLREWGD